MLVVTSFSCIFDFNKKKERLPAKTFLKSHQIFRYIAPHLSTFLSLGTYEQLKTNVFVAPSHDLIMEVTRVSQS